MTSTPLVIAGAGPVGLTAALELTRRGVAVRVLEKNLERAPFSKALAVNPRSLALLEASGATERLLAQGLKVTSFRIVRDGRLVGTAPFDELEHRYPFMLGLEQSRTEAVLEACLRERGIAVERGVEVLDLRQDGGGVALTVRRENREEEVAASLVLAADGAHSTIRKALGLEFPGRRDEHRFQMIDAEVDWPHPHDAVAVFVDDHRPLATIPLPEDRCYRFIAIGEDPAARIAAHGRLLREIWRSDFQVSYRLIERMAEGLVYFAGDAAHIHSPIGARGMNLGIEDACVFAQCVAKGTLDGYGAARRSVARGVLRMTEGFTNQIVTENRLVRWLRDTIGFRLLAVPALRRRARERVTGLDHPNPVDD